MKFGIFFLIRHHKFYANYKKIKIVFINIMYKCIYHIKFKIHIFKHLHFFKMIERVIKTYIRKLYLRNILIKYHEISNFYSIDNRLIKIFGFEYSIYLTIQKS